jgi:hypothetical protein
LADVSAIAFFLEVLEDLEFGGVRAEVVAILGNMAADHFFNR